MTKAILVGAGGMGKGWGRNLRENFPEVELVAWVDIVPGAAERAIAELELSGTRSETNLERTLTSTDAEILIDVSVPEAHEEVTLAALKAGLDVIGEKPMAPTLAAARRMIAAAEESGRTYMVSQSRRFDPNLLAFRNLVCERLGDLGLLYADFFLGPHFGGFRDEMDSVLLIDMAIHHFDAARAIFGRDAVNVYAEEFSPSWSWYAGAAGATCLFEMEGGGRFEYRGLWAAEGMPTSWNAAWRAIGAKGSAIWDGESAIGGEVVVAREGFLHGTQPVHPRPSNQPFGIQGSFAEFLTARAEGRRPISDGRSNFNSLAMVLAAVESARMGHRVPVESLDLPR